MSDLQCPARFVLVRAGGDGGADVALDDGSGDPVAALEDLADLYRGETLVVALPPSVVPRLPSVLRPPDGGVARVEVDADGWRAWSP